MKAYADAGMASNAPPLMLALTLPPSTLSSVATECSKERRSPVSAPAGIVMAGLMIESRLEKSPGVDALTEAAVGVAEGDPARVPHGVGDGRPRTRDAARVDDLLIGAPPGEPVLEVLAPDDGLGEPSAAGHLALVEQRLEVALGGLLAELDRGRSVVDLGAVGSSDRRGGHRGGVGHDGQLVDRAPLDPF